jgi:uncharacterized membrane protein
MFEIANIFSFELSLENKMIQFHWMFNFLKFMKLCNLDLFYLIRDVVSSGKVFTTQYKIEIK